MILLLGGTGETGELAKALVRAGYRVLVSTATDAFLAVGSHPAIRRRCGRLDPEGMEALVGDEGIVAIVDGTHPFAAEAQRTARAVAEKIGIPCLRFQRASQLEKMTAVTLADDHEEAARLACSQGAPVLLTTGSRNLIPYIEEGGSRGVEIFARVLPHSESIRACEDAGLPLSARILGRGPFTLEENRSLIRRFGIGVLVTKESGPGGGVMEKLEAARLEGCRVVVVRRPEGEMSDGHADASSVVDALKRGLQVGAPISPKTEKTRGDIQ